MVGWLLHRQRIVKACVYTKGGKLLAGWGETGLRTLSQRSPGLTSALNSFFSPPLLYLRPNSQSKDKGRHEYKRFQLQLLVSEGHLLLGVQRVLLMFCRSRDLVNSAGFIFITKYTCIKKIHMHEIHHLHHHSHPPVTAIFNS